MNGKVAREDLKINQLPVHSLDMKIETDSSEMGEKHWGLKFFSEIIKALNFVHVFHQFCHEP